MTCRAPIDLATLLAHWLGELVDAEDNRIGEHLMGCGACTAAAQWIADLSAGVRLLVREGAVHGIVTAAFVQRAIDAGIRAREYRLSPGSSVNCTVAPGDDLLVTRLEATLAAAERVDLVYLDASGRIVHRLDDIPFDVAAGEVIMVSRIAEIRAMPETRFTMRLITGDRSLGDYTFHHKPWPGH